MEDYDEETAANSELRFLTIELMKIAVSTNRGFDAVLCEYFENAYKLKSRLLMEEAHDEPDAREARHSPLRR
ncbi:MAG: hypothetical protein V1708_03985 [Candidatus Micrarchaeota archaeon]